MTPMTYHCTSCVQSFQGIPSFAAHIQKMHDPAVVEDELEQLRRRALNLPDEDEDDDDDELEDELLPTSLRDIAARVELVTKRAAAAVAERNHPALEALADELRVLEPHLGLTAEAVARYRVRAEGCLRTIEWVLRDDAPVIS